MTENEPVTAFSPLPRRRLVLPAIAASLALGVGGAGLGYGIGHHLSGTRSTASGATTPQLTRGDNGQSGGWVPQQVPHLQDTQRSAGTEATRKQVTGLVRIVSTMRYDGGEAAGTGMVLASTGEVVTNHHVVQGATSIKATVMSTGKTYPARLVGSAATSDVAVLRLVGASGLETVNLDTDGTTADEPVTAVGDGNGTEANLWAATGTILADNQAITTQDDGSATGERLTGLLEISSDVVSGYSGGATYDSQGEVVGMTTAASSGPDVVGYVIPIATVTRLADAIAAHASGAAYTYGYPAFLGVGLAQDGTVAGTYAGTPADQAGITEGSTITRVDRSRTPTATALQKAIAAHRPGDRVKVTWRCPGGTSHLATVTLAKGPVA